MLDYIWTFQIYGMQASAPCRIVEMTAEVLGLEYEFKVLEYKCTLNIKPVSAAGGGPPGGGQHEA